MSYQQIPESGDPSTVVNENNESLGQGFLWAHDPTADSGLVVGLSGGDFDGNAVADTTVTGTDNATNYIVVHRTTRAASTATSTTNWNNTSTYGRVARAVFASGVLTFHDERNSPGGIFDNAAAVGGVTSVNSQTGAVTLDAGDIGITDAGTYYTGTDVEAALQEVGAALAAIGALVDVLVFKGAIDCSANPNYPAANAGDVYKVSVAGKIGGGSGPNVEAGDSLTCTVDASGSGTHASVGANWFITQSNIDGAVIGPASSTDSRVARFDGVTGKLLKDGGTDAALVAGAVNAATAKTTPVDADEFGIADSAASYALKKLTWANLKAGIWSAWGALINGGTGKTTPVDADAFALMDSADSNATKKVTWANAKATLKTYFDTLYAAAGGTAGKHAIYIAAGSMRPSASGGCAVLATVASAANQPDIVTLDFDTSTEEYAQFGIVMPKSWDEGTLTFKAHWSHASTSTNFGVAWKLQAVAVSDDDAIATAFGTAVAVTDTGGTTNDLYTTAESSAITVAGSPAAEDMVFFRVFREPSNGSDTMAIDARLHGITLYITTNAETDA